MKSYQSFIPLAVLTLLLTGYNFLGAAWTIPGSAAPADNIDAPLTVSTTTQTKNGPLTVNILAALNQMRSNQYCDGAGNNCWDPRSGGTGTVGGGDTLTVGGRCFQPALAVACMWNWSGDGNDTATYIRPVYESPTQVCASVRRTYMYHNVITTECFADNWLRSAWVRVGTTNRFTRTITCVEGTTGTPIAETNCPATRPATTCTDTTTALILSIFGMTGGTPTSANCPA